MVTVELQSVIGNYTKCLHNLSFNHPYHSKRPTDVGGSAFSDSVSQSVPVNALAARLFIIHPMHTARACTVQPMKQQHYTVQLQNKNPKLNCLPNVLMINLILS